MDVSMDFGIFSSDWFGSICWFGSNALTVGILSFHEKNWIAIVEANETFFGLRGVFLGAL